jgi:hypothetical protein
MKPYTIPGFEDAGGPGMRKPVDTKKLEQILKPYLEGGGVAIQPEGQITQSSIEPSMEARAQVAHLPMCM